jgi:predicted lysophospholipase L1 biosynthesis ABC-type transport system permease subunit
LKALGLTRRQVAATVAWQATALAVAALVIGTPLGVVAGKLAWAAFATSLGVPTGADIPVFAVLATVAGALLAANALAAGPALAASWAPPAEALRSE